MRKSGTLALVLLWALLSPPFLPGQDFSSIDKGLEQLEGLIADTLRNTEEQQRLLNDFRVNLDESESIIENYENIMKEREKSLRDLQGRLHEMSETYRRQSALSARSERSSRFWRTFTLIAVPVATGLGIWAGTVISR